MTLDSIFGTIASSLRAATEIFQQEMRKEYQRGYDAGASETRKELEAIRKQLRDILGTSSDALKQVHQTVSEVRDHTRKQRPPAAILPPVRSARGSVEPKVISALNNSPKGKKPSEIVGETGIPEPSVRGTLNKLRKAKRVEKRGETWLLIKPNPVAAPESSFSDDAGFSPNG